MTDQPEANDHGSRASAGFARKLRRALVVLLVLACGVEIVGRCIVYQRDGKHALAIVGLLLTVRDHWRGVPRANAPAAAEDRTPAPQPASRPTPGPVTIQGPLPSNASQLEYADRYVMIFERFVELCRRADATLAVVFIPDAGGTSGPLNLIVRDFFVELCAQRDVPLLDLLETLGNVDPEVAYLLPEDGHASRFGNSLIAHALVPFVVPLLAHRTSVHFTTAERPALLGDLPPSADSLYWEDAPVPCRVGTNAQGLRRHGELVFPRPPHPRILCVGDSFTFGHGVANSHTYPQLLEGLLQDAEVVNGGVAGYTICDEYAYFSERGRFVEPDLVLLQVFPNDFEGFRPEEQKVFCRGGEFCPGPGEQHR